MPKSTIAKKIARRMVEDVRKKAPLNSGPTAGKGWSTAGDSKVCEECAAIAKNYKGSGNPPVHPNCRCRIS